MSRTPRGLSAGHLSREFRLAYGQSPYSYLMTRRIERAMALLRRGDLSVTEVCFEVGCSSPGTFSAVLGETGDQTDQESRSAGHPVSGSLTGMDITIHASALPHDDPEASLTF